MLENDRRVAYIEPELDRALCGAGYIKRKKRSRNREALHTLFIISKALFLCIVLGVIVTQIQTVDTVTEWFVCAVALYYVFIELMTAVIESDLE